MNWAKWGLYFVLVFLLAEMLLQSCAKLQSSQFTVNKSWIKLSKCSFKTQEIQNMEIIMAYTRQSQDLF